MNLIINTAYRHITHILHIYTYTPMLYRRAGGPVQGGRHPAPGPAHSRGRGIVQ